LAWATINGVVNLCRAQGAQRRTWRDETLAQNNQLNIEPSIEGAERSEMAKLGTRNIATQHGGYMIVRSDGPGKGRKLMKKKS
jgi:hypothetical protein